MTITQALIRSINVIPVRLSISLGDGNPKLGRAKIIQMAQRMGIRTPLPDSLLAADRRRGSERARSYRRLRNLPQPRQGGGAACHDRSAQRQRRNRVAFRSRRQEAGAGDAPADRDGHEHHDEQGRGGRHRQAHASSTASSRRARPAPPTPIAMPGSSATPATMSRGVWYGNDDYAPTNRMTGGSLPGDDLAADHGLCASGHRDKDHSGRPPGRHRPRRRSRAGAERPEPAHAASNHADQALDRGAAAGRAHDG